MANPSYNSYPHVALLASSGVGHLTPLLRLAAALVHHHCRLTLITCHPILTLAESQLLSNFFSAFPQVKEKQLHLLPSDPNHSNPNDSVFFLNWEAANRSVLHHLPAILSSLSPSPCALVSDVTLIHSVFPVTENLNLPVYVLFVSCARMFSLFAYYPIAAGADSSQTSDVIEIPGGLSMPKSIIPPPLQVPNSAFASIFMEGAKNITKSCGVFINTFERLEAETLAILKSGKVVKDLPPLITVGLMPCEFEKKPQDSNINKWLDDQPQGSVVYVSFGSKVAVSREQTREIGDGLIRSGYPFLWVVKDKEFDREDAESLNEVLGNELMEKIKNKGLVAKEWVNQGEILGHPAVGGFVSHSGWNSVVEAAWHGVRMLAYLSTGDQKVNKQVVEKSGLGLCPRNWGWVGEMVVKGEELAERIKEMMGNEELKLQAKQIREEARKAVGVGGSCENALVEVIEKWKSTKINS